jgi:hypothetical protein
MRVSQCPRRVLREHMPVLAALKCHSVLIKAHCAKVDSLALSVLPVKRAPLARFVWTSQIQPSFVPLVRTIIKMAPLCARCAQNLGRFALQVPSLLWFVQLAVTVPFA